MSVDDYITALTDSQIEPLSSNEFLFSDKAQPLRDVGTVLMLLRWATGLQIFPTALHIPQRKLNIVMDGLAL